MIVRKVTWEKIRTHFSADEQMALTAAVCRETPLAWEIDADALGEPLLEKLTGQIIHAVDMSSKRSGTS